MFFPPLWPPPNRDCVSYEPAAKGNGASLFDYLGLSSNTEKNIWASGAAHIAIDYAAARIARFVSSTRP
jgi:hypothetical protein